MKEIRGAHKSGRWEKASDTNLKGDESCDRRPYFMTARNMHTHTHTHTHKHTHTHTHTHPHTHENTHSHTHTHLCEHKLTHDRPLTDIEQSFLLFQSGVVIK